MDNQHKGQFTFRTTAVLFVLSALLELYDLDAEAPLFGAVVGGAAIAVYHLLYAVLFAMLGTGLWTGRRYGYYAVFVTTGLYTIDRLQLVLWQDTLAAFVQTRLAGREDLLAALGLEYLLHVLTLMTVVMVACWWGFAAFTYVRRAYFSAGAAAA